MIPGAVELGTPLQVAVVVASYPLLLATSGIVVRRTLAAVDQGSEDAVTDRVEPTARERDVGVIVGKTENVLPLTFLLVGAYTALAVVFAAKNIVRKDDIEKNSLFYLAGTLVNFTYSVVFGVAVVTLVRSL